MKRAFITGVTGQDGSYLSELLLDKGYEVHGLIRRQSTISTQRIDHLHGQDNFHLHFGDLTDGSNLARLIQKIEPNEVYNLGAQSHVRVSFDCPEYTVDVVATGTMRLLEAIRLVGLEQTTRYYQASSSEMFGGVNCPPGGYTEEHPFYPRSPYGCAKVYAYYQTINYRQAYSMHASNGILFNHESPRRGETFVTRKITRALYRIVKGQQDRLVLGNLNSLRDWGHAKDYVRAMWLMLQQPDPGDYVVATGETHSVREFLSRAFLRADLDYSDYVDFDRRYLRPSEVDVLQGNPIKARTLLGWTPEYTFDSLIDEMVSSEGL